MSSFYLKWTKNHVHTLYCLRYGLWRMQLLFFILGYFLVFYSPSSPKNENFKKMKKHLKISSFNASVPKIMIMLYCFWDNGMWRMYLLFFILGYCLFTPSPSPLPSQPKKWNFQKNEKKLWRYHHFTWVHQKSWSYVILILRYGMWQMPLLFFISGYFLAFYSPNSWKNQNFKKMRK